MRLDFENKLYWTWIDLLLVPLEETNEKLMIIEMNSDRCMATKIIPLFFPKYVVLSRSDSCSGGAWSESKAWTASCGQTLINLSRRGF